MEKTLKIIVKLAYDRMLVLEPTQDNMKLAMQLVNLPLYDDKWEDNGTVYVETDYAIDVRMEKVLIRPQLQPVLEAAE